MRTVFSRRIENAVGMTIDRRADPYERVSRERLSSLSEVFSWILSLTLDNAEAIETSSALILQHIGTAWEGQTCIAAFLGAKLNKGEM